MDYPAITLWVDSDFFSPYALSAYVALKEKGLDFQLRSVDLSSQQQASDSYRAVSLTRRVPSLQVGEFLLSESSAITEYLEERFPAPEYERLYPRDIEKRARAREIQAWLRSDFLPIREERPTSVIFAAARFAPLSETATLAGKKLIDAVLQLLPEGQQNVFGEWSIADTDLAVMLNRLALHGDLLPQRLSDYAAFQWQRASIQLWLSEPGRNG
ncbi:glutathione transferase [Candidatus Pantoea multigeneris]|uniref:Glutathione transferase n=1 Tax=Candidatus Pantoea multigeneris TaxID=2608357 RepID=A0ABX0R605_9GAMM|nr:glutathione transferase [Pantoea multigeneris]NIF20836.1 glutathione transferase [Pantoea multigeneris]